MPYSSFRKLLFFILTAFLLASCISQKSSVVTKPKTVQNNVINYGEKYLNRPYQYASQGPSSFDCSGFTSFVFKEFGYNLSASSSAQAEQVETIRRQEDLNVGDLVFFEGRSHNGRVGHVGIVSDVKRNGKFRFLHASTSYGVIYSYSDEPYYKARYLRGGRVIKNSEPKKMEKVENEPKVFLAQHIPDKSNKTEMTSDFSVKKNGEENNFTKADKQTTTHVRNADGTVSVQIKTLSNEEKSVEQKQASKPKKNQNPDEEKEKDQGEIRQSALLFSEESLLPAPTRTSHVVKPGETLFSISISKKHKCSVEQLQKWNPEVENNVIQSGDRLNIYQ